MIEAISTHHARRTVGSPSFWRLAGLGFSLPIPRDGTSDGGGRTGLTDQQIKDLIARDGHGNSHEAIRILARDRHKASERARKAEAALEELRTKGLLAKEGDVIVTGDVAKEWPDVQKFLTERKLTPKQLIELAGKVPDLEAKVASTERTAQRATAAKAFNYNAKALDEVLETKGLELSEEKIRGEGGKTETVWCVRKAGDDKAPWIALDEYVEENLSIFKPALEASENEDGESNDAPRNNNRQGRDQQPENGTRWARQSGSRKPTDNGKAVTDEEIRQRSLNHGTYNPL